MVLVSANRREIRSRCEPKGTDTGAIVTEREIHFREKEHPCDRSCMLIEKEEKESVQQSIHHHAQLT
jgi:hypothetical protein